MGCFRDYLNNTRKPQGKLGKMMLLAMNKGHAKMAAWGMEQLPAMHPGHIVDLGCGGGRNAAELMKKFPTARMTALDYSEVSVEKTKKVNAQKIANGRCTVIQGDVSALPMQDASFDLATAFETIYFWPGLVKSFREVCRVLKPGGQFYIVNESDGTNEKDQKWVEIIDGMHLYAADEICAALKEAGFLDVTVFHKPEKCWIAFLATKG